MYTFWGTQGMVLALLCLLDYFSSFFGELKVKLLKLRPIVILQAG